MSRENANKIQSALVIGGSGFLGSHIADSLTNSGYNVTIFDKSESPYMKDSQHMIVGDILEIDQVCSAVKDVDIVYHFAGIAGILEANANPLKTVHCNVIGTTNVLEACVKAKITRIIFASTVYVYSDHGGFYRSTKQAAELLIENYHKYFDLDFTILRFGSLYGRRGNEFNFIHNIITQALVEGKMVRSGNGDEIREYIHVEDAAKACVDILNKDFKNEYVILTGSQSIKVKDLLKMIGEMFNNQVAIEFNDHKEQDHYEITPFTFRPRIAKKYYPTTQIDLGQGILDTIYDIYKKNSDLEDMHQVISLPD